MAITKYTFSSLQDFADWAEENLVSAYFKAVDLTEGVFTGYRDTEKTEPVWVLASSGVQKAYKNAETFRTADSQQSGMYPAAAWVCRNGVLLDLVEYRSGALITKSNRGETATVIGANPSGAAQTYYTGESYSYLFSTAWGDDPSITAKLQWSARTTNQTALVPFCTDGQLGKPSFTPYAYYMPDGQYHGAGFGRFTAAGKTYITNGYWAILEG